MTSRDPNGDAHDGARMATERCRGKPRGSDIKTVTVGIEIVARAPARRRVATAVPACGSVCAETY
jgi:hypothetical protein